MAESLRELEVDTCLRLLGEHSVGRLAFTDDDGPMILPVNYLLHEGSIVFRSDLGSKLSVAEGRGLAAFEIDHADEVNLVGWSVVVRGRLTEVTDPVDLEHMLEQPLAPFVVGDGKRHVVRLQPRSITGRVTVLPADLPAGWFRHAVLGTDAIPDD